MTLHVSNGAPPREGLFKERDGQRESPSLLSPRNEEREVGQDIFSVLHANAHTYPDWNVKLSFTFRENQPHIALLNRTQWRLVGQKKNTRTNLPRFALLVTEFLHPCF